VSPSLRQEWTSCSERVDLPAPGGPVIPIRRARPRRGWISVRSRSNPDRPFSTIDTARATAGTFPARSSLSSGSADMTKAKPGREREKKEGRREKGFPVQRSVAAPGSSTDLVVPLNPEERRDGPLHCYRPDR